MTTRIGTSTVCRRRRGSVLASTSSRARCDGEPSSPISILGRATWVAAESGSGSGSRRARGIVARMPRMAMPAMPRTASSPKVSRARNSTRMTLTMLSPPVTCGAWLRYHCATSERSRRPMTVHAASALASPAPIAITALRSCWGRFLMVNSCGSLRSTSMMTNTVRISTSSWVRPTSAAPRRKICTVIATPTPPSSTVAPIRDSARTRATTEPVTMTRTPTSTTWLTPGVSGGTWPPVHSSTDPTARTAVNVTMMAATWRAGLSARTKPAARTPTRSSHLVIAPSTPAPSRVKRGRSTKWRREARRVSSSPPTTKTSIVTMSSRLTPCHRWKAAV